MAGTLEQNVYMFRTKWQDSLKALEEETGRKTEVENANKMLTAEVRQQKDAYAKMENFAKNCEKAAEKAHKEASNARSRADHLVNSQKGQLRNAERRAETATRELTEWKDKYGWSVGKPAQENHALLVKISELQSKADKSQNQVALLEAQIRGTPMQIGLHQALEQWEEHQGCSAEFADLQDKLHDATLLKQKLESDLAVTKERYQKAKSEIRALQSKANQLDQTTKAFEEFQIKAQQLEHAYNALLNQGNSHDYMLQIQKLESDRKTHTEQCQKLEWDMKALQEKADQLEHANRALRNKDKTDVDMLDDDILDKEKLVSELQAVRAQHQKTESDLKELKAKAAEMEQATKAFQDQNRSQNEILQRLESDRKAGREQLQEKDSNLIALQEKASWLESDLTTAKEQYQKAKSDMKALQQKTDQLKSDLKTAKEQHQTTKPKMEALQEKADQLASDLQITKDQHQIIKSKMGELQEKTGQMEMDLKATNEQHQTTKSEKEVLRRKADQLEIDLEAANEEHQTMKSNREALQDLIDQLKEANKTLQEKDNERIQTKISENREQDAKGRSDSAARVRQANEDRMNLMRQGKIPMPEPDPLFESLFGTEHVQVTPPSSPTYTTDEGSQDLDKTPRPKKSLRQDLGYSSRDQSDEEQSDVSMQRQQGEVMPNHANIGEEKKKAGTETWETDVSEDTGEHRKGSMGQGMKKLASTRRRTNNVETLEARVRERAKEQSEVLETLFECTPAKAHAIDRRLKALGPGCRLQEAPALVANELSGIPENTYKGLASGQLIATTQRNEVKDVGTDPVMFTNGVATDTTSLSAEEVADSVLYVKDMATDTADLPPEEVARSVLSSKDMATDTTDLRVEGAKATTTCFNRQDLFSYFKILLMMIFFGVLVYMVVNYYFKFKVQYGILYKNIYSQRHTPFPMPSINASTPIRLVFPPTPAPQLGLARMMRGSPLEGELGGRKW